LAISSISLAAAFVERPLLLNGRCSSSSSDSSASQLNLADLGVEAARTTFPIWFFGAIGSGGLARPVFPRKFDEWRELQKLKGVGPTKGGPSLTLNPLCGYPEPIAIADLKAVIDNTIAIADLVASYPVEDNYMSSMGMLTGQAFDMANEDLNPLAVKAVFDSFGKGSGVEPAIAQERLDEYRKDLSLVQTNLLQKALQDWAALIVLLFLIGLADTTTASLGYQGFFPEWPGGANFPWSMFTEPNGSPFTIPDYWDAS